MKKILGRIVYLFSSLEDLPPLIFRLILAYGFYEPAIMKWKDINSVAQWFGESLHVPFPLVNAYMAASTEIVGVALLTIGFATRFISLPMMFIMVVAIVTVHYQHGFTCGKNGFEVPFYYFFMLFSLVVTGAGRVSLDHLLKKRCGCCKE